jgi:hypothetical protein
MVKKMIKRNILMIALVILTSNAFAGGGSGGSNSATTTQSGVNSADQSQESVSVARTQNSIDMSNRSRNFGTDVSKSVPYVTAPSNSVGFNVCDSTASFGIGFSGLGFSFGLPISDEQCNRRADAREVGLTISDKAIAKEVMCSSKRVFRASYRAGRPCFPESNMLDELTDSEMKIYKQMLNAQKAQKQQVSKRQDDLKALEQRFNKKLDNFHRINQMK